MQCEIVRRARLALIQSDDATIIKSIFRFHLYGPRGFVDILRELHRKRLEFLYTAVHGPGRVTLDIAHLLNNIGNETIPKKLEIVSGYDKLYDKQLEAM